MIRITKFTFLKVFRYGNKLQIKNVLLELKNKGLLCLNF